MFNSVLVPLDGSALAEEVLPYVAELARRCGSRVVLLQVVSARPALTLAEFGAVADAQADEAVRLDEEEARTYLEWTASSLRQKGLEVEWVTSRGPVAEKIVRYAKENAVDLIAVSTHGRSGLGRLVLGSVADEVMRTSGIPVLVFKPTVPRG